MKRVEVRLNLEAVAPLLDVIKAAADELRPEPAVPPHVPDHDEDFAATWRADLLAGQTDDLAVFLGLFGSDFFVTGIIPLDSGNCEAILRASAAVRLKLRSRHLESLGEEALESGDAPLSTMPELQQKAFAAYVFLATLQELIVQHLDPTEWE